MPAPDRMSSPPVPPPKSKSSSTIKAKAFKQQSSDHPSKTQSNIAATIQPLPASQSYAPRTDATNASGHTTTPIAQTYATHSTASSAPLPPTPMSNSTGHGSPSTPSASNSNLTPSSGTSALGTSTGLASSSPGLSASQTSPASGSGSGSGSGSSSLPSWFWHTTTTTSYTSDKAGTRRRDVKEKRLFGVVLSSVAQEESLGLDEGRGALDQRRSTDGEGEEVAGKGDGKGGRERD